MLFMHTHTGETEVVVWAPVAFDFDITLKNKRSEW